MPHVTFASHLSSPTSPSHLQAVVGAVCMVAGGASSAASAKGMTAEQGKRMLVGDVCLLINTLAMAVYYIVSKQMVAKYPAICVAAWAYLVGERRLFLLLLLLLLFCSDSSFRSSRTGWGFAHVARARRLD